MTMMTGTVEDIGTKVVKTKFGDKPTYSMKVGDKWIKCGFKDPKVAIGNQVDFDAVLGTYGLETKGVNILSTTSSASTATPGSPAVPPVYKPSSSGYSRDKVFPIPPLHGDRSIVRQNALARATELYVATLGGKSTVFATIDWGNIIALAKKFEAYTAGDTDMKEALAESEGDAEQLPAVEE
jgi:hypothetical protein